MRSIHDGLINHPELAERFNSILKIANGPCEDGEIRSADQVKSMPIEVPRKLGNEGLVGWGEGVDHRLGEELKGSEPTLQIREKNSSVVESFWFGQCLGNVLVQT